MIDIQTLTIGSHILYKGEQVEVFDMNYYSIGHSGSNISHNAEYFDPIPITEELLKELGFEEVVEEGLNMFVQFISAKGTPFGSYIMRVRKLTDDWEFEIPPIYLMRGKYLHELETFVYLTTKKDLI